MLSIISPSGEEAPIITKDYSITENLGSAITINATFPLTDENKVGAAMIQPFAKIREPTTHEEFYLDSPKIDDSGEVEVWTLTGTQKGPKELSWQYISGTIKSNKTRDYKLMVQECLEFLAQKTKKIAFQLGDTEQDGKPITLDLAFDPQSYPDGFGNGNALDLLKKCAKDFGFEYRFENYTCIVSRKLGVKDAFVFIDSVNCQKINMQQTYSNIKTRINVKANPYKTTKNSVNHSKKKSHKRSKLHKSKYATFHKLKEPEHATDKVPKYEITVTATKSTTTDESNSDGSKETWKTVQVYKENVPIAVNTPKTDKPTTGGNTDGTSASSTKKPKTKKSGPIYQLQLTYTSPMVAKNNYPVIDHKPVVLKGTYTKAGLLKKAKSLLDDQAKITITVTGANFKKFSHPKPAEIQIGNQGWLKPLHGSKEQYSRITGYVKYPADDSKEDQVTIGNVKLNPVSWMMKERQERRRVESLYADMQNAIYDIDSQHDLQMQSINNLYDMTSWLNDWQAQNYQLILKNSKSTNDKFAQLEKNAGSEKK
ncbi:phage tail protein [Lactobacillus crispatus]|uniref:phage tail protein n=1 Tax=Lactobacillus crispatus TaxID=47770 RepID=UPI0022DF109E|nr:phage tail protein [Lactobacillus crispatus]